MALRPSLTLETLKRAYEALQQADDVSGSPLLGFVLVRRELERTVALSGVAAERHAVFKVLVDIVSAELAAVRGPERPFPTMTLSIDEAISDMAADGGSPESKMRIGYSSIFYRYLRSDLDLTVQRIADYLGHDVRNVHRYTSVAWRHLLQTFIQREMDARLADRRLRCLLALPQYEVTSLPQQQVLINSGKRRLLAHAPFALLIHGVAGAGKSIIALKIAETLIDERVGEIAWIDLAGSSVHADSESLANLVVETLGLYRPPDLTAVEVIDGYLRALHHEDQQFVVVLDGAEGWEYAVNAAHRWLSHCVVIVTARVLWKSWFGREISCPLLAEDDALVFIGFLEAAYSQRITEDECSRIWRAVGGNPAAIKRAFQLRKTLPVEATLSQLALADYYIQVWDRLSAEERSLWFLVDIAAYRSSIPYQLLISLADSLNRINQHAADQALVTLWQGGLIESVEYRYRVPVGVAESLAGHILDYAAGFVEQLLQQEVSVEMGRLAFHFFQCQPYHEKMMCHLVSLIPYAHRYVVKKGYWERWLSLLWRSSNTARQVDQMSFKLEAVVALRWLGRFEHALELLRELIGLARQSGQEIMLGEVLVEKANILFYQHANREVVEVAQQAHAIFEAHGASTQLQKSRIALVRALSRVEPHRAQVYADEIEEQDATVWDLLARLAIQTNNPEKALEAAENAVRSLQDDDPLYPRSLAVLAHAMIVNDDVAGALERFEYALNLLQVKQDVVALARMHNNFGVALSEAEKWQEARQQFMRSLDLHQYLQDEHGRAIAEENLRLLQ